MSFAEDALRDSQSRSEARLQGARGATLDLDESSRRYGDRTVNGGTLRPMANDGKVGEDPAARTSGRNTARKSALANYWDDWRVCYLKWMDVNEERRIREKAEQKTKITRRTKIPERVIEDDVRGIADVADDLMRPSEDQLANWTARRDAASGRRRTDPEERTGASPNSATSSEGKNRS